MMMDGMNGMMHGMMGWMMGIGLLGWVLVIALLATIVVVLVRLLARDGPESGSRSSNPRRGGRSELP